MSMDVMTQTNWLKPRLTTTFDFTGTDKEKAVLTPQSKDYNQFGQECVRVGCSVDLFLFNNAYIDIATISQVIRTSSLLQILALV